MEALPRRVDVDRAVGPTRNRDLHGMLLADVAHVEEMLEADFALAIILDGLPFDRGETVRHRRGGSGVKPGQAGLQIIAAEVGQQNSPGRRSEEHTSELQSLM